MRKVQIVESPRIFERNTKAIASYFWWLNAERSHKRLHAEVSSAHGNSEESNKH